jgi:hypothetical protein
MAWSDRRVDFRPDNIPKMGTLKINRENVANFSSWKVTVNLPAFTSNPPQINHQKTTFCTPFLAKPPAKTATPSHEKKY